MTLKLRARHFHSPFLQIAGRRPVDPWPFLYKGRANWRFQGKMGRAAFIGGQVGGISHHQLGRLTNLAVGTRCRRRALCHANSYTPKGQYMLARILGAIAGEKFAGPNQKVTGALVGAAIPTIARRGLGPLGLALAAGWGAKKLIERRRSRRGQSA